MNLSLRCQLGRGAGLAGGEVCLCLKRGIQTPMARGRSTKIMSVMRWTRTSWSSIKNSLPGQRAEGEFVIDNLLVRIHFIIEMIWWTGLAPWVFEFPFPGSLTATFLGSGRVQGRAGQSACVQGYLAHKKTHHPRTLP